MRDIVDHRYRIEQKLAVGGFGTIYRATDTTIGRQVALKILHRELAGDANVVARFRREIAALAKLKSPHTLTLYDVGTFDDTLYFVMELLRGESLQDVFLRTGPLPWRRIAGIGRGVCASLLEAHALGIIHRDLKPANIFLETHALDVDYVKVLDFGIAKILASSDIENRDLTRHGQMVGTFDYMAPEQMIGGVCTSKSDVFTLGIVLYELLTGGRPYAAAAGPAQMLVTLMTTTPAPLSGVPPELARIVMKCLSREPHDRPDVDQLDRALESVLSVDEAAFGDADEPTWIAAKPLRPGSPRTTLQRGSMTAFDVEEARRSIPSVVVSEALAPSLPPPPEAPRRTPQGTPIVGTPLALAQTLDVRPSSSNMARGSEASLSAPLRAAHADIGARTSEAAIARDIELALAATVSAPPIAISDAIDSFGEGSDVGPSIDSALPSGVLRGPAKPDLAIERIQRESDVAVRFAPTPREPVPTPKSRLALGTSSPANEPGMEPVHTDIAHARRAISLPLAPESSALTFVRYSIIAVCLFGVGFLLALALWSW